MDDLSALKKIMLANGTYIFIRVADGGGEFRAGPLDFNFSEIVSCITGIAEEVKTAMDKVKPQKAKVEFGIEATVKSGKLVAALSDINGKGHIKVTLEW